MRYVELYPRNFGHAEKKTNCSHQPHVITQVVKDVIKNANMLTCNLGCLAQTRSTGAEEAFPQKASTENRRCLPGNSKQNADNSLAPCGMVAKNYQNANCVDL